MGGTFYDSERERRYFDRHNKTFKGHPMTEIQNGAARALGRYDVLHTEPEDAFDRVTRLACTVTGAPAATLSFVDGDGLWAKSRCGSASATGATAFCAETVRLGRPLVLADATDHPQLGRDPSVLGAPFVRFFAGMPLRTPDGQVIGVLSAFDTAPRAPSTGEIDALSDLSRVAVATLELRRLATADALTGVLTAAAFREEAKRAFGFARRHRGELSCVLIDVDGLAALNARQGRAAGDAVLAAVAASAAATLRAGDRLGRLAGDVFAVVLPLASAAGAAAMADRLRAEIASSPVTGFGEPLAAAANVASATLDATMRDADDLLAAASDALNQAKARRGLQAAPALDGAAGRRAA